MEQQGRRVIVTEGEPHRLRSIRVLLENSGHEIVAVATTRQVALQAIGDVGVSGADVLLLDDDLMPDPGYEQAPDEGGDARAILAAIAAARASQRTGGFRMDVIATGEYPMAEYGITEGVTRDIGHGGIPQLPEVLASL